MKQTQPNFRAQTSKAKTPLLRQLQKAFRLALFADKNDIPADEVQSISLEAHNNSRRKFIEQSAMGLAALGAGSMLLQSCQKGVELFDKQQGKDQQKFAGRIQPKIVIVGGGMAGLNCAFTLKKNGYDSTIYEANTRTGGRILTANNIMGQGLTTELGGEFIDSGHKDMLQLVNHFGFNLIDVESPANNGFIKDAYFFNGIQYTEQDIINAFAPIAATMQADIDQLPDSITYTNPGGALLFDNISLEQYISNLNCAAWLKSMLTVAFVTEYGLDAGQQSCINMLYLISTDTSGGKFEVFGDSDEQYKIAGGNQKLTNALTQNVSNQIAYEHKLEAVNQKNNGKYVLTFRNQNNCLTDITTDYVVFAIPFTILRTVNFGFKLPKWKQNAIDNLGYGTNAKLLIGFQNRPWRTLGYRGYAFTDKSFQSGWDNSELQAATAGGYTMYLGGTPGVQLGTGTAQSQANIHLPGFGQLFPGSLAKLNGNVVRFHWPTAPFMKGSYACYKPGQFTTIAGAERKPVDNLYFAGEHCSLNFQGYMNGAAETGRKAAEKILGVV